jgi:uroporphyrinogen decarboxylase
MDEVVWPFYKEALKKIKEHKSIPVFFHSDGNINSVLDAIAGAGFDGLHSLQPSAGMDISWVNKEYGASLCLMGNIDLDYILTMASPEEVTDTVKRTIDIAGPGGGFILSSCNVLTRDIPARNVVTMYETAEGYGRYRGSYIG